MSKYQFNKAGVNAFLSDTINDCLDYGIYHNIKIAYGEKEIELFMCPEIFEMLERFLPEAEKIYREEYMEER